MTMILRALIVLVTFLLMMEVECHDEYLASEFRVLTDVLESVIFGAILKNTSVNGNDISIHRNIISNADSSNTNGVSTTNGKKLQSLKSVDYNKLNSRRPIKKRRKLKNSSSPSKTKINGNSTKNLVNKKEQKAIEEKPPKFFRSSKISSKRYNSPKRTRKRNPITRQQKIKYKQIPLRNEVEARLLKIKRLFDYVKDRKDKKKQKKYPNNLIQQKASEKDMEKQKINTPNTDTKEKHPALVKLYEIAGDEWMKNNMK